MRKLALALVALSTLAFAAPSFVASADAAPGMKVARADVVKVAHRRGHVVKKVVVRRGPAHRGFFAHRHPRKVVVVKHRRPVHAHKVVVVKHRR